MNLNYEQLGNLYSAKPEGYYGLEREEMLYFISPGTKKILDVGCGDGGFGRSVRKYLPGTVIWGIEPNEDAAKIATGNYDKVIRGSFGEHQAGLEHEQFDCIAFNDVLEHMADPGKALHYSRELLSPGGYVIASIPNILFFPVLRQIIQTQDWKYIDYGILDNTHLRFFTRKSIIRLFEENGFAISEIKGISKRSCGRLYKILNTVFYKKLEDWKFMQFGVRATPRN